MAWFRNTILAAIAAVVLSEIDSVPFTWGTVSEVVVLFLFAEDHLLSKTSGIGQNATCARLLVLTTAAAMIVFRALIFLVAAAGGAGILIDGEICAIKMHGQQDGSLVGFLHWRPSKTLFAPAAVSSGVLVPCSSIRPHQFICSYLDRRIFIYNLQ